ncbi:MAG: hypothetical protein LBD02_00215 [Christensenellaceae bacterium]|jgi:hypothetical protein|nr:hypothetical protein [Christensenellaceae bacterium]
MLPRLVLRAVYFALAFFGPSLLLLTPSGVDPLQVLLVLLACAALGLLLGLGERFRRLRLLLGALPCALLCLLSFGPALPASYIELLLCLALYFCIAKAGDSLPLCPPTAMYLGFVGYGASTIFAFFLDIPIGPALGLGCFLLLSLTILLVNRDAIQQAAGTQARRMLAGNQALSFLLIGLIALLAFAVPIKNAFVRLMAWLFSLLLRPGDDAPAESGDPPPAEADGLVLPELGEAAPLPPWLEAALQVLSQVFSTLCMLFFIGLMLYCLYRLFHDAIWSFLRFLQGLFAQPDGGFGYTEESEALLSAEGMGRQIRHDLALRFKRLLARPLPFERLSPAGQMRRLYQIALKKALPGLPHAQSLTPEQFAKAVHAPEGFAADYTLARYGARPFEGDAPEAYRRNWRM